MYTMENTQRIGATKARNNFFQILQDSFMNKKPFLVEKGKIPMVYIIPVTADIPEKDSSKDYAQKLLEIEGDWFQINDLKKTRKEIEERLTKNV